MADNPISRFIEAAGLGKQPVITDPDSANDEDVATAIQAFQEAAKAITDKLADVSNQTASKADVLSNYQTSVTLAYVAALDGNMTDVIKNLKGVVGT